MLSYNGKPLESKIYPKYPFKTWKESADTARKWLLDSGKEITILIEQNRNLGDTLHLTPVIRHFRINYPEAAIAFMVGQQYSGAHEFNPHVDKVFCTPVLNPQDRIKLRKHLLTFDDLTHMISPSIFPYASVWPSLTWSYADLASQYFANSGIGVTPDGGRKLVCQITDQDIQWAKNLMAEYQITRQTACILEYHTYSNSPKWRAGAFVEFAKHMRNFGVRCISLAGINESPIGGTINSTGASWRQSAALMNEVASFVGVGSGLTMLAASAEKVPHILEIAIDDPVNMKGCGYADGISIRNPKPREVADHLWRILNG
jgi:hypothetical protein